MDGSDLVIEAKPLDGLLERPVKQPLIPPVSDIFLCFDILLAVKHCARETDIYFRHNCSRAIDARASKVIFKPLKGAPENLPHIENISPWRKLQSASKRFSWSLFAPERPHLPKTVIFKNLLPLHLTSQEQMSRTR
jgi:hypothetical protein